MTEPAAAPRARLGLALVAMLTFAIALVYAAGLFALAIDRSAGSFTYIAILALVAIIGGVVCSVISAALGTAEPAEPALRGNDLMDVEPAKPYDGPVKSLMSPYEPPSGSVR